MIKYFLITFFVLSHMEATLFLPLDSTILQQADLSSRYQNRIAVNGERISSVIHPESDLEIVLDEDVGQLFIFSLTNYPQKTTISVVTESGKVQDLELSFYEKASEIVIIEPQSCCKELQIEPSVECYPIGPGHPDYMVMVVEGVLSGIVPEGFVACDISPECRKIKKGIRAVLVSKLVSLEETVYVWRVENTSYWNLTLSEKELNFQKGSWVYLDKNNLGKKEQIIGIVGVQNYVER